MCSAMNSSKLVNGLKLTNYLWILIKQITRFKTDGLEVSRVQVTKFLGVLVDETLSWSNYINAVCKNVSRNIYVIDKVKHIVENNHLYMLYCSLILPYLSYTCEIWRNTINYILWWYYKESNP